MVMLESLLFYFNSRLTFARLFSILDLSEEETLFSEYVFLNGEIRAEN